MRATLLATLLVSATLSLSAPTTSSDNEVQLPLSLPYLTAPRTVSVALPQSLVDLFSWSQQPVHPSGDEDDICPKMKVSCVKDGKTVGDIGKKPFCRSGVTCGQCHQTENTAECNAKFIKDCVAQCEAQGPLGGTGHSVMAEWFL